MKVNYSIILLSILISAVVGCSSSNKKHNVLLERSGYFQDEKAAEYRGDTDFDLKQQKKRTIDAYLYPKKLTDDIYMLSAWTRIVVDDGGWKTSRSSKKIPYVREKLTVKKKKKK